MSVSAVGSYGFLDRMVMSAMNRTSKTENQGFDLSQLASQIVKTADSDGDGVLSSSETKLSTEVFQQLDTDGSGQLTAEELLSGLESSRPRQMPPPPPQGPPPGERMDSSKLASSILSDEDGNGDGVLSADETGLSSTDFNTLDTDGDGKVTSTELQAALDAHQAERAQQKPPEAMANNDLFGMLMQTLQQNQASTAYGQQDWLQQLLQDQAQTLKVSA